MINSSTHSLVDMVESDDPKTVERFYDIPRELRRPEEWEMMIRFLVKKELHGLLVTLVENYFLDQGYPRFMSDSYDRSKAPSYPPEGMQFLKEDLLTEVLLVLWSPHGFKRKDKVPYRFLQFLRYFRVPLSEKQYDTLQFAAAECQNEQFHTLIQCREKDRCLPTLQYFQALIHWQYSAYKRMPNASLEDRQKLVQEAQGIAVKMKGNDADSELAYASLMLLATVCDDAKLFQKYFLEYRGKYQYNHIPSLEAVVYCLGELSNRSRNVHTEWMVSIAQEVIDKKTITPLMVQGFLEFFLAGKNVLSMKAFFDQVVKGQRFTGESSKVQLLMKKHSKYCMSAFEQACLNFPAASPMGGSTIGVFEQYMRGLLDSMLFVSTYMQENKVYLEEDAEMSVAQLTEVLEFDMSSLGPDGLLAIIPCLRQMPVEKARLVCNSLWYALFDELYVVNGMLLEENNGASTRIANTIIGESLACAPPCLKKDGITADYDVAFFRVLAYFSHNFKLGVDIDANQMMIMLKHTHTLSQIHELLERFNKLFCLYEQCVFTQVVEQLYKITGSRQIVYSWFSVSTHRPGTEDVKEVRPHVLEGLINLGVPYRLTLADRVFQSLIDLREIKLPALSPELPSSVLASRVDRADAQLPLLSHLEMLKGVQPQFNPANRFITALYSTKRLTVENYLFLLTCVSDAKVITKADIDIFIYGQSQICNLRNEEVKDMKTPVDTFYAMLGGKCNVDNTVEYPAALTMADSFFSRAAPWMQVMYLEFLLSYTMTLDPAMKGLSTTRITTMTKEQIALYSFVPCEYLKLAIPHMLQTINILGTDANIVETVSLLRCLQSQTDLKNINFNNALQCIYESNPEQIPVFTKFLSQYDSTKSQTSVEYIKLTQDLKTYVQSYNFNEMKVKNPHSELLLDLFSVSNIDDPYAAMIMNGNDTNYALGQSTKNRRQPFIFPNGFFTTQSQNKRNRIASILHSVYISVLASDAEQRAKAPKQKTYATNAIVATILAEIESMTSAAPLESIQLPHAQVNPIQTQK